MDAGAAHACAAGCGPTRSTTCSSRRSSGGPPSARVEPSPVVDLARFDPEKDMPRESGRKARRLARDGEPRFVWHEPDAPRSRRSWAGSATQYARTGVYDIFATPGFRRSCAGCTAARRADLAGVLACLYDGEDLIAAQLVLLAGPVMHLWMPALRPGAARTSRPASCCSARSCSRRPRRGPDRRLRQGHRRLQERFANDTIEVGDRIGPERGSVACRRRRRARLPCTP